MSARFASTALLLPLLSLAACIPPPVGPVPSGLAQDEYGALQHFAAQTMNCPREKLSYETFGKGRHLFKGCEGEVEMILFQGSDAQAYGGSKGAVFPAPANRFAKETKCPLRSTSEERIDFRTRIVEGCGRQITYVNVCTPNCSWIANVETKTKKG
jgi:hypothetical protein